LLARKVWRGNQSTGFQEVVFQSIGHQTGLLITGNFKLKRKLACKCLNTVDVGLAASYNHQTNLFSGSSNISK
jgi:hypothetical protein